MWHASGNGAYLDGDLGAAKTVKQVKFWNRAGCCQDRAVGAYITLFDVNRNIVTGGSAVLTIADVQSFYLVTRPADTYNSFTVAATDRVAGKVSSAVTFSFRPRGPWSLTATEKITLNYPTGFFATSATPTAAISGTSNAATRAAPTQIGRASCRETVQM